MKMDVVIGNPPYKDIYSGGPAVSIYDSFVYTALQLNPRLMILLIPSKWLTGSKKKLVELKDRLVLGGHLRSYIDYLDSYMILDTEHRIPGGCGYFLYDKTYTGECMFAHMNEQGWTVDSKDLRKYNVVVRDSIVDSVIQKVNNSNASITSIINDKSLVINTDNIEIQPYETLDTNIKLYTIDGRVGYVPREYTKGKEGILPYYSVLVYITDKETDNYGVQHIKYSTLIKKPMEMYGKHFVSIGKFNTCIEAVGLESYINTKLVRFLINNTASDGVLNKETFQMIPMVDISDIWTDERVAEEFKLTEDEIKMINDAVD